MRISTTLQIQLNGEPRDVADNISIPQLLASLNLKPETVAVELNQSVIRRAQWENTTLKAGDKVEIVHFVGGGFVKSYPQITQITQIRKSR